MFQSAGRGAPAGPGAALQRAGGGSAGGLFEGVGRPLDAVTHHGRCVRGRDGQEVVERGDVTGALALPGAAREFGHFTDPVFSADGLANECLVGAAVARACGDEVDRIGGGVLRVPCGLVDFDLGVVSLPTVPTASRAVGAGLGVGDAEVSAVTVLTAAGVERERLRLPP